MTFERTISGISNLAAFHRVKAVVFVEGGKYFDREGLSTISPDIAFWHKMFAVFWPHNKYKFRAVGSKANLVKVAERIVNKNIKTVYVAMDRDYDNFHGKIIEHQNILYTHGYSWENDLLTVNTVKEIFYTFCPVCRESVDPRSYIEERILYFARKMYWPVYTDILLSGSSHSFIEAKAPGRIITGRPGTDPSVSRKAVLEALRELQRIRDFRIRKVITVGINPIQHCKGAIVGHFAYLLVLKLMRKYGGSANRVDKHPFFSAAIAALGNAMTDGSVPGIAKYYGRIFGQLQ